MSQGTYALQQDHPASPERASDAGDHGCLIESAVEFFDGVYQVNLRGVRHPLLLNGEPVAGFAAGWRPGALFLGFSPLLVLEFQHEGGNTGYWFLDHRFEHMAANIPDLRAELREFLCLKALPILREIAGIVDRGVSLPLGAVARGFLRLSEDIKQRIGQLLAEQVFPRPKTFLVSDFAAGWSPLVFDGERTFTLAEHHLAAGFEPEWQDRLLEAATSGTLRWSSPIDGTALECRGSIIFDDFHFAYRFVDQRHALVFYVLVGDHYSTVGGIWFPSIGIMVSLDEKQRGLGYQLRWHLPHWLMTHLLSWAPLLDGYFRIGPAGLANVLRGNPGLHIGHQLWNELTGISRLVDTVPNPRLSHLVLGRDRGLEIYGPIDEIFPSLRGKVLRNFIGYKDMIASSYRSGAIVFRITRDYVSRALRDRLAALIHRDGKHPAIDHRPGPVILFGLRVENRTLVDLDGFLHKLMTMIDARYPSMTVVFDGHNASGDVDGRPICSHGESLASVAPDEVEKRIVEKLRLHFPHRQDRILDTIMQPVSSSLAWARVSCGFLSIWGASLAKYRWVANLPGFVITSAHNLRHRQDLDIYHSPRYMEDPSRIDFIDPDLVADLPEAAQLVPVGGRQLSFSNFRIDEDAALAAIRDFLDFCLNPDAASGGRALSDASG